MGKVMAICISEIRGVQKKNVHTANLIENWGVEHDAHAGNWHRQLSLLSYETIQDFNRQGAGVIDGAFGENLVISGYDFTKMKIGTRFRCGDVVLELTQIGKECHNGCEIFKKMMLELYASMAQAELEKKEKRQREGIEAKKLRGEWDDYGRPSVMKQETFDENFQSVVSGYYGFPVLSLRTDAQRVSVQ